MAGGGDVLRAQQPGGLKAACLPLDVIAEIAALSDPATLVRCAATCRDARRRIAHDTSLLGRLRLRDTDRFVLPLLRGHMIGIFPTITLPEKIYVYMVDITSAADATRLVKVTFAEADETLSNVVPMDSRGGLVLVRNTHQGQLLVCNLATRCCLALPPVPAFPIRYDSWISTDWISCGVQYVLLVGGSDGEGSGAGADASVGRPFQVLIAKLVLSKHHRSYRHLLVHIFSSGHGAWSPLTEIPTPDLLGGDNQSWHQRPLVIGDVVHWLYLTDSWSYMLMLHVGGVRVNVTSLPASFPRDRSNIRRRYLLATEKAGGNPIVLIADADQISAWKPSKHTKTLKLRVMIENETILGFKDNGLAVLVENERMSWEMKHVPELLWFGERSGVVLIRIHGYCLLWLDLHSKKIVRCFSSRWLSHAPVYCPYEVDLSSWVPTFSSASVTL